MSLGCSWGYQNQLCWISYSSHILWIFTSFWCSCPRNFRGKVSSSVLHYDGLHMVLLDIYCIPWLWLYEELLFLLCILEQLRWKDSLQEDSGKDGVGRFSGISWTMFIIITFCMVKSLLSWVAICIDDLCIIILAIYHYC